MSKKYTEYKSLNLPQIADEMLDFWEKEKIFEKSISSREGKTPFVFYEGPPSANGLPGIHHVMARAIKDIFCRYKTLKGFQVNRKAGWDTHGLPIELSVEKSLGITKEDIGKKISIEEYNNACRKEVMKYTDKWEELTKKMGYWVDMQHPYITYENKYIESVWWLLKNLHEKQLLYKGDSIQPYSPAAGTGLSTHELNQPGCYRNVKDRTAVAMFKAVQSSKLESLKLKGDIYFLAWTTTPWTLPANMALAVGKNIIYVLVKTINRFTGKIFYAIVAKDLFSNHFESGTTIGDIKFFEAYEKFSEEKKIEFISAQTKYKTSILPGETISEFKGADLEGIKYEQLLPYVYRDNWDVFRVIMGNFVTTKDGTGIVHIAPTFGADDKKAANDAMISPMFVQYEKGGFGPIVDSRGRFRPEITDFAGEFVKEDYLTDIEKAKEIERLLNLSGSPLNELISKIVTRTKQYLSVDERIILKLELEGKLFKKETYEHSYPHCWRTDKPIIYYPLDSWFIKTSDDKMKSRMIELNNTINWKPKSTGAGRFGEWLNNIQDWNLSRSRFWGIPLPLWSYWPTSSTICVGTFSDFQQTNCTYIDNWDNKAINGKWYYLGNRFYQMLDSLLKKEGSIIKDIEPLFNNATNFNNFLTLIENNNDNVFWNAPYEFLIKYFDEVPSDIDLHKPYIDNIIFVDNKPHIDKQNQHRIFKREADLIDVWFDSGSMPFAQMHFPFENVKEFSKNYPADFIAEGVDQTRGWFYTLHAISSLLKEEVQKELQKHGIEADDKSYPGIAYKNVISNGLVLDKNGNKMSKRLGNAADPFVTLEKYGADATRWYMITNASPWDNLKFDLEGITEVQRKFFGTLYNTYNFFALYANIDGFDFSEKEIAIENRPEIDRWILSELNSLIKNVNDAYADYEPTKAGRAIEFFVDEHLSNWYVRLCRRRFWKGEYSEDKIAAYQTLYKCLETIAQLASPIAPFFTEKLFLDLNKVTGKNTVESVHLSYFPEFDKKIINIDLEERMELAQKISSMILSIRKKENIRVRQPLNKIQIPVLDDSFQKKIEGVKELILSEVNVKNIDFVNESTTSITKNLKLNFKTLGKKCGKNMKAVQSFANENAQKIIFSIEKTGKFELKLSDEIIFLESEDVEIIPVDIPGWKVTTSGGLTVALDIIITPELKEEGIARELVNRIQNLRKDSNLDVTDKISVKIQRNIAINTAIINNFNYICSETLASSLEMVDELKGEKTFAVDVNEDIQTLIFIDKLN